MMTHMIKGKSQLVAALFLVLLVAVGNAAWGKSPAHSRLDPDMMGNIDHISLKAGTIVVDDSAWKLAPGYTVVNSQGKRLSAFNLKRGMAVTLELDSDKRVKRIIIRP